MSCVHRWKVESPQVGHRGINARCHHCGATRAFPKSPKTAYSARWNRR